MWCHCKWPSPSGSPCWTEEAPSLVWHSLGTALELHAMFKRHVIHHSTSTPRTVSISRRISSILFTSSLRPYHNLITISSQPLQFLITTSSRPHQDVINFSPRPHHIHFKTSSRPHHILCFLVSVASRFDVFWPQCHYNIDVFSPMFESPSDITVGCL